MELIDKSALVAEIKRLIYIANSQYDLVGDEDIRNRILWSQQASVCSQILSFIDTLEVKEVDLDNEYIEEVYSHLDSIKDTADRMTSGNFMHNKAAIKFSANTIVEVLELMGIKAQKGE